MTQQKSQITSSFSVESIIIVDVQLHPEATWLTIISYGREESRCIVLMQGSFQKCLQRRLR